MQILFSFSPYQSFVFQFYSVAHLKPSIANPPLCRGLDWKHKALMWPMLIGTVSETRVHRVYNMWWSGRTFVFIKNKAICVIFAVWCYSSYWYIHFQSFSHRLRYLPSDLHLFSVCLSAGPGWSESSSEELEGDCYRSAGHTGGLFPHHYVCHPPHTR